MRRNQITRIKRMGGEPDINIYVSGRRIEIESEDEETGDILASLILDAYEAKSFGDSLKRAAYVASPINNIKTASREWLKENYDRIAEELNRRDGMEFHREAAE